jgi:aryl-alcohol dehydrogenase-like predicted oxidoreductase
MTPPKNTLSAITLPRLGVGAMPFSGAGADTTQAEAVWHHTFDLGLTLINTADCYAPSGAEFGHNERLVGAAVSSYAPGREAVTVVTKIGITRDNEVWARNNSPEYLKNAAQRSVERLGLVPDVMCIHRLNREQSLSEAVTAMCEIRDSGLTQHIGLSNVSQAEFDLAWEVSEGTIAVVENEQSPRYRAGGEILESCRERNVSFLAWSPLGGGSDAAALGELYPAFAQVAQAHGATAQQIALAWLLAKSSAMTPIPAFTRMETADSSRAALDITLSQSEVEILNASPAGPGALFPD